MSITLVHTARQAILLASLVLVAGCGDDVVESRYATVQAAENDDAFVRGLLPEALPTSARDIHEAHNLDTHQGWIALEYEAAEHGDLSDLFQNAGWDYLPHDPSPGGIPLPDPPVRWWPDILREGEGLPAEATVWTRYDGHAERRWWAAAFTNPHRLYIWHYPAR